MTLEIGLVIRRDNEGLVRIPFCIGVGLALLAGPALAQKAERPEVKVGDRWQFVRYYSVASTKPNLTWEINSVTETEILGTENGEPLRMTPDLNVVDLPERKQSTPKALSFPLEVGKSWRYATDWLFKPKGSMGSIVVDVEVVARERIAVPAGEFEAFKLVSKGWVSGSPCQRPDCSWFLRNLTEQQAKSWELRAAISVAAVARSEQTGCGLRASRSGL